MTSTPDIQRQIDTIRITLRTYEEAMNKGISKDLKRLRHHVMFVHSRVEETLQIILAENIKKHDMTNKSLPNMLEDYLKLWPIFDQMEFHAKMNAVMELKLLPKNEKGSLTSLMWQVNNYRKYFSHPTRYRKEIDKFNDPKKHLEVLKVLRKTISGIDTFILENDLALKDN